MKHRPKEQRLAARLAAWEKWLMQASGSGAAVAGRTRTAGAKLPRATPFTSDEERRPWTVAARAASWLAIQLVVASAYGQSHATSDESNRLFREGRALMTSGSIRQACDAFAQSYRIRPAHGTLLNLAVCLEQSGDLVAAFYRFEESLSAAVADGRADREQLVRTHLEALRTKLSWLTIELDAGVDASELDLRVSCDGVAVREGAPIPVMPGSHVVRASAPDRVPFETALTTVAGGSEVVRIPALAVLKEAARRPSVVAAPLAASRPTPSRSGATAPTMKPTQTWRGTLSVSLLTAGIGSLWVGALCGARAISDANEIERLCADRRCGTDWSLSRAQRLEDRAKVAARVADVTLPLGALAIGASLYLSLTRSPAPRATTASLSGLEIAPVATPRAVGTSLRGTW